MDDGIVNIPEKEEACALVGGDLPREEAGVIAGVNPAAILLSESCNGVTEKDPPPPPPPPIP